MRNTFYSTVIQYLNCYLHAISFSPVFLRCEKKTSRTTSWNWCCCCNYAASTFAENACWSVATDHLSRLCVDRINVSFFFVMYKLTDTRLKYINGSFIRDRAIYTITQKMYLNGRCVCSFFANQATPNLRSGSYFSLSHAKNSAFMSCFLYHCSLT